MDIKFIRYENINNLMKKNVGKGEIFYDDYGQLYIVDRGDLHTYWLLNKEKTYEEIGKENIIEDKNPFLD